MRNTVADLAATGTTVLLTTHYMAEADELCDRIAVIAGGEIQALGTAGASSSITPTGRRVLEVAGLRGRRRASWPGSTCFRGTRNDASRVVGAGQVLTVQSDAAVDVQGEVLRRSTGCGWAG